MDQTIEVNVLLVPESKVRLFSPQIYFEKVTGGKLKMNHTGSVFNFVNSSTLSFKYSTHANLPIYTATVPYHKAHTWSMNAYMDSYRLNIFNSWEELLYWYDIFGHYDTQRTQALFNPVGGNLEPVVIPKLPATKTCSVTLC